MSFDYKCYELARYFASDIEIHFESKDLEVKTERLAQVIQDAIEQEMQDWVHDHVCQQCEKVVKAGCTCDGEMMWCSANCRAAFDL